MARRGRSILWTEETVLSAIDGFHKTYGRVPTLRDFDATPGCPTRGSVIRVFGSWSGAIMEAGLKPNTPGPKPREWVEA